MISSSENRVSYNGNGTATEFAYQFKILEKSDIKVMRVDADGNTEILTKDYYVDTEKNVVIYPGYAPGAEIPESERPPVLPSGWRLVLYREVPITQLSRLPEIWPFNVIEAMADKLTIICQQLKDAISRCLKINESSDKNIDTTIPWEAGKTFRVSDDGTHLESTEDPGKVYEASKGFAEAAATSANNAIAANKEAQQANEEVKQIYNNGMLTPISDLAGSVGTELKRWGTIFANKVFASNLPLMYNSVSDMKSDKKLKAGMTACTLGYYSPNDGGAGTYIIRAKQDGDVDDGGSLHEISGKLVAELVVENGTVNVKQFGAKGDGVSDDTEAILHCIATSFFKIYFPNGTYSINQTINISQAKHICGKGTLLNNSLLLFNISTYFQKQLCISEITINANRNKVMSITNNAWGASVDVFAVNIINAMPNVITMIGAFNAVFKKLIITAADEADGTLIMFEASQDNKPEIFSNLIYFESCVFYGTSKLDIINATNMINSCKMLNCTFENFNRAVVGNMLQIGCWYEKGNVGITGGNIISPFFSNMSNFKLLTNRSDCSVYPDNVWVNIPSYKDADTTVLSRLYSNSVKSIISIYAEGYEKGKYINCSLFELATNLLTVHAPINTLWAEKEHADIGFYLINFSNINLGIFTITVHCVLFDDDNNVLQFSKYEGLLKNGTLVNLKTEDNNNKFLIKASYSKQNAYLTISTTTGKKYCWATINRMTV